MYTRSTLSEVGLLEDGSVTAVVVRDFKYNDVHKQLLFMHGGRSAYRGSDGRCPPNQSEWE